jgi:hypothetical protein
MSKNKIELLDSILVELSQLKYGDSVALDALLKRAEMIVRRLCGDSSRYVEDLGRIWFSPMYAPASEEDKRSTWARAAGRGQRCQSH